jgi:hypothetical protein
MTAHRSPGVRLVAILALVLVVAIGAGSAQATVRAKKFKNCAAVHKVYKHGIAKSRAAARHANGLTGAPKISAALYKANKGKDRDHDGVACER